jgi:molybdenum cofactor cytidylyltransferase
LITGIVLAAGLSKRMGEPKQSLLLAGKTILDWSTDAFLSSSVDDIIVIVNGSSPRKHETSRRLRYVVNPNPSLGISSSLKLGIRSVRSGRDAVVVGLGDKPLVLPGTINALVDAYRRTKAKIIVPIYEGKRGNPVLFQKSMFRSILELSGDVGAREVISSHEDVVSEVPVGDRGILLDIDTPSDVSTARAFLTSRDGSR